MGLPNIRADQDAFSAWFLQPSGIDPGDALGFFGVATASERQSLIRRGFVLLGDVVGDMSNPEDPLVIRPPTMARCEEALSELRRRVPVERDRLLQLMRESEVASTDAGLPMSERQIYRERAEAFRFKIAESYRVLPIRKAERTKLEKEAKELEGIASNTSKLDDERREARDEARQIRHRIELAEVARPYTPAALRRYFLFSHRIQIENRIPKPHRQIQERLQQIAALEAEEAELAVQDTHQARAILEDEEEPVLA